MIAVTNLVKYHGPHRVLDGVHAGRLQHVVVEHLTNPELLDRPC